MGRSLACKPTARGGLFLSTLRRAPLCPLQFPQLPLVGKLGDAKPLPTFKSRVTEAGDIEVDV